MPEMASMKNMNETLTPVWTEKKGAPLFFNELAHGVARSFMSFMVDSSVGGTHPLIANWTD